MTIEYRTARLLRHPWALTKEALEELQTSAPMPARLVPDARRVEFGSSLDGPLPMDVSKDGRMELKLAARHTATASPRKAVGLIRINGTIEKNPYWGGVDIDKVAQVFGDFASDESVGGIVLHIDSPGGGVFGVEELGKQIVDARKKKPVVAVADGLMASAAYWIGASATKVVATPSSLVGSIGVFMLHMDMSKMLDDVGIKPTFVSAGRFKTEGNPLEPLSDEGHDHTQELVDSYYTKFVKAVAKGRGVKTSEVRKGYGEGRVLTAERAVEEGMVDEIGSVESAISELSAQTGTVAAPSVELRRRRFNLTKQQMGI